MDNTIHYTHDKGAKLKPCVGSEFFPMFFLSKNSMFYSGPICKYRPGVGNRRPAGRIRPANPL